MNKFLILFCVLLLFYNTNLYARPAFDLQTGQAYFSSIQEQEIGKKFMQELMQSGRLVTDPVVTDYVRRLGRHLRAHSNDPRVKITFFVINSPVLNAFAGPGGYIGINSGLVLYVHDEGQLAAILSHEIAHVTQQHISRLLQQADSARVPTLAAALASVALGIVNPALGASALSAATAGYQQHLINFTRANEREADRVGMQTLYGAGFDPMSMPLLFESLAKTQQLYPNDIPEILRTHPYDEMRVADSKERAALYPKKAYASSLEFALVQARLRVATSPGSRQLLNYFRNTSVPASAFARTAWDYGHVLALIQAKAYPSAQQNLQALLQRHPEQILFKMASAQLAAAQQQDATALEILEKARALKPDYAPLMIQYAITLSEAKKYRQAIALFRQIIHRYPDDYTLYPYLATAQAAVGELQDAYLTRARMFMVMGDKAAAQQQLHIGLRQRGKNPYGRIQIEAMLKQVKQS